MLYVLRLDAVRKVHGKEQRPPCSFGKSWLLLPELDVLTEKVVLEARATITTTKTESWRFLGSFAST